MTNPFKGEVLVECDGKRYTFVLGVFAQTVVEEETGMKWPEFWQRSKDWATKDTLVLFGAGLALYHEDMSRREISRVMDRLGGARCAEIITEAMEKGSPDSEKNGAKPPAQEDAKGSVRPTPTAKRQRSAQPNSM